MRALSMTQPWATLVATGAKAIETRSWGTSYRGPLAIHAAKAFPGWCKDLTLYEPFKGALAEAGVRRWQDLPLGCVIAVCRLAGCKVITVDSAALSPHHCHAPSEPELSLGDYTPGRWAWLLADVLALPDPVPARGMYGLWAWDEALAAGVTLLAARQEVRS